MSDSSSLSSLRQKKGARRRLHSTSSFVRKHPHESGDFVKRGISQLILPQTKGESIKIQYLVKVSRNKKITDK